MGVDTISSSANLLPVDGPNGRMNNLPGIIIYVIGGVLGSPLRAAENHNALRPETP